MKKLLAIAIIFSCLISTVCRAEAQVPDIAGAYPTTTCTIASLPGAVIYQPIDIAAAVDREGLLPLVLCLSDGESAHAQYAASLLSDIASRGFIVANCGAENASAAIDRILGADLTPNAKYSSIIDAEYICLMQIGSIDAATAARSADARYSSVIAVNGTPACRACNQQAPMLWIASSDCPDACDTDFACADTISKAPCALARCTTSLLADADAQSEAAMLIHDWHGWLYKGQSNKRTPFVTARHRGISDKWTITSANFLQNYQNQAMPTADLFRFEFDSAYPDVHDPVVACEDGKYYMFTTGQGIGLMSSDDGMRSWQLQEAPLQPIPAWACEMIPAYKGHTWAPDIVKYGDDWYLYYSCSTFGKNISAIGVATSKSLDPATAEWHDLGMVVRSIPGVTDWNAIDPNVAFDAEGNPWLTFGSFWDGIQLVQLASDMRSPIGQPVTIARRRCACKVAHLQESANTNAIEAPFIVCHDGMYYLFASYDYCCQGLGSTYKTAVGRSQSIAGPYLDHNGIDMADTGGEILIAETPQYAGVGHCAVYDFDGTTYFIAHAYDKEQHGRSKLYVREIEWIDGWPVIAQK